MFEYIRGRVVRRDEIGIVVEAGGIGYRVHVTPRTARDLPQGETTVFLHESVPQNDARSLFGFASLEDRNLFRTLLKVKGVGPRGALAVLAGTSRDEFLRALASRDVKALTRLKGIGKKTAERILVELGDHIPRADDILPPLEQATLVDSAVGALASLGVERDRALQAIQAVRSAGEAAEGDLEGIVRAALRRI